MIKKGGGKKLADASYANFFIALPALLLGAVQAMFKSSQNELLNHMPDAFFIV